MLVAAALVPDTVLLVPGASGRTDVLGDLRAHALAAVRAVLARAPRSVVVVAPGTGPDARDPVRDTPGPVRASLAPAGVPDRWVRWGDPATSTGAGDGSGTGTTVGPAASVAVLLLSEAGWRGPVRVVETTSAAAATGEPEVRARLAATGRGLAGDGGAHAPDGPGPAGVALVVVGSLSARHGPDAPRADDERAPAYDAAVLADLADAGRDARARLAALDPALAHELDVTGWAPWQVLVGAAGDTAVVADVLAAGAPLGAQHVVATWAARA